MKKNSNKNLTFLKNHSSLLTLKCNSSFCNRFFERNRMSSITDDPEYYNENSHLIYDYSKVSRSDSEVLGSIIDLLLQLRAAQSDQNVLVQNNTVIREHILSQLKNEVLKVNHKLTSNQIKNLEVLSSNYFDEKTLTDILNSFLKDSKKKSEKNNFIVNKHIDFYQDPKLILKKDLASYYKSIYDVKYNEKIFNKKINRINNKQSIKDINLSQLNIREKSLTSNVTEKVKNKSLSKTLTKKLNLENKKETAIPHKLYEKSLIKTYNLILPIIQSQVKLSETEVLNKTKLFVEDIINKNIIKMIPSQTELVNKVLVKTQVNELRESFLRNYERYDYYHAKNQTEIRRIQNDIKKIQSLKNVSYNKNYVSKPANFIESYTKNLLKKNILKIASGNEVLSRFENISENYFNNYIRKKAVYKRTLINKTLENDISKNNRKEIYNKKSIKYKSQSFEDDFFKDFYENNVLINKISRNRLEYKNLYKNFDIFSNENLKTNNFKKLHSKFSLKNFRNLIDLNNEINTVALKNFDYEHHKSFSNLITNKTYELLNFLKFEDKVEQNLNILNKGIDLLSLDEKREFIKNILQNKRLIKLSSFKEHENKNVYLNKVKLFKKIASFEINSIISQNNIVESLKDINSVKKSLSFMKNYKYLSSDTNINNSFKSFGIINSGLKLIYQDKSINNSKFFEDFYADKSYLVYKQSEKQQKEPTKPKAKPLLKETSKKEVLIPQKPKPIVPQVLDADSIEKHILAKTLGKKEIVDLIKSYISQINLDSISKTIMDKIESRMILERKRNGIF